MLKKQEISPVVNSLQWSGVKYQTVEGAIPHKKPGIRGQLSMCHLSSGDRMVFVVFLDSGQAKTDDNIRGIHFDKDLLHEELSQVNEILVLGLAIN